MSEIVNKTLAQIVTDNFRTASVFEKYNLDFCCKGKRSLQQACDEQNLQLDEIVNELSGVAQNGGIPTGIPFTKVPLSQLADYIVQTHHSYVKREMPQIHFYLTKIANKHGGRHPELYKILELFSSIKEEMEHHMIKEEQILFPRIKDLEKYANEDPGQLNVNVAFIQSPITVMEHEHDHAGHLLSEIRKQTNNFIPPPDACTTYKLAFAALQQFEIDLHQHVHLENNILFPRSLELFKTIQPAAIN